MARTLLDEQLPVELKAALTEVGAASVHALGWSGVKNGSCCAARGTPASRSS
jgi:hypothetical protein